MKILIVDDERMILVSLKRYFKPKGYAVIEAASAEEAIQAFDANPDTGAIITDLKMEDDNSGLEVLRHARAVSTTVKLCITSGTLTQEVIDEAKKLGADALDKPYDLKDLCARLGI